MTSLAVTPDNSRLFVASYNTGTIQDYSIGTDDSLTLLGQIPIAAGLPSVVAYDVTYGVCSPDSALCIDPSPPNGSGGFYPNPTFVPVPEVTVGTPVSLTVTAIQPGAEGSNGTFTLTFPTADLAFTGTSSDGTCGSVTTAYRSGRLHGELHLRRPGQRRYVEAL